MTLKIVLSNQFKKDLKLAKKRGKNIALLERIVDMISREEELPEKLKDHQLIGNYRGFRECHIEPDWLLIYRIDSGELCLMCQRTGTHADLF